MRKIICIVLIVMLSCMCFAEDDRIELMRLGGIPVYMDEVKQYAQWLHKNGQTDSDEDYLTALEYILRFKVGIELLIKDASEYLGDAYERISLEAGDYYDKGYSFRSSSDERSDDGRNKPDSYSKKADKCG